MHGTRFEVWVGYGKLCVWSRGGTKCRGSSVTLGSQRGWLWVVNGRANSREGHKTEGHPSGTRSEWRCVLCLHLFSWAHHEMFLNKCSGVTAPPWERHWSPLFPFPVQLTLGKRKRRLTGERRGKGDRESVSKICYLSLHFGENMHINAPSAEKNPLEIFGDWKWW